MKKYMDTLSGKSIIKDQSLLRHEEIRRNIRVLPTLQAFIPPLLPDELAQLEANIRRDGCREALLVWETTEAVLADSGDTTPVYVLVDGHNRYMICQRNGIDFRVNLVSFADMTEVRSFMIDNQLGRRNLTPEQTAYFRGLRYLDERGARGKYQREGHKGQNVLYAFEDVDGTTDTTETAPAGSGKPPVETTAQKLARQYHVNEKTIKRDAEFAAGVEKLAPALKADVLAGKSPVSKTAIQQLARTDAAAGSIESFDALLPTSPANEPAITKNLSSSARGQQSANARKQLDNLHKQLQGLVAELATDSTKTATLCDAIVDCATKLKTLVTESH
jgi:citrate lyase gamma subunit